MGLRSAIVFSFLFGLSVSLTGCTDSATPMSGNFELSSNASASALWDTISKNARAIGARVSSVSDGATVVTYSGNLRDFVVCRKYGGSSNANGSGQAIALDSRTKIILSGSKITADTVYIATTKTVLADGSSVPLSTTFSGSTVGKLQDGISCRATGNLERQLLGQK